MHPNRVQIEVRPSVSHSHSHTYESKLKTKSRKRIERTMKKQRPRKKSTRDLPLRPPSIPLISYIHQTWNDILLCSVRLPLIMISDCFCRVSEPS